MARMCDTCGESFDTLTRLRLHDCPEESEFVQNAFLPEPDPEALSNNVLTEDEASELKGHSQVSRLENMMDVPLPGNKELFSFVLRVNERSYGLHCDNDTFQWSIVAEGENHEQVKEAHQEWLSDDIEAVTGGATDADQLDELDVPETITDECSMCGESHELTPDPDSFLYSAGVIEYEGFCDETNHPINVIQKLTDLV